MERVSIKLLQQTRLELTTSCLNITVVMVCSPLTVNGSKSEKATNVDMMPLLDNRVTGMLDCSA